MSVVIHPTAQINPKAELSSGCRIGAYVMIEGAVCLGPDCTIESHAILQGPMTLGSENHVYHHTALGLPPQDLKYAGEETSLEIGHKNCIREYTSIHRGTAAGRGRTSVGSGNLIMSHCHIAHDVMIGDGCVLSSGAVLGGHVQLHNHATVGGLSGVHQFARIGRYAFVGGCSAVDRDILPYGLAAGNRAELLHYNAIGLRRHGFSPKKIEHVRELYRKLLESRVPIQQELESLCSGSDDPLATEILKFVRTSHRGLLRRRKSGRRAAGEWSAGFGVAPPREENPG